MKKTRLLRLSTLAAMAAAAWISTACVVATPPVEHPPGVAYVEPGYPSPGAGWVWRYHAHEGWGWWHPDHGWHRGWR